MRLLRVARARPAALPRKRRSPGCRVSFGLIRSLTSVTSIAFDRQGRLLATEFNTGGLLAPPTVPGALVRVSNNGQTVTTLPVPGLFQLTGLAVSALAAVPVFLQAAIGESLGTAVSAAGHSQQAELTAAPGEFGFSVALSALGRPAGPRRW